MKRSEEYPLQKVTLNLRDGDFAALAEFFPRLGASKVIRELVKAKVDELRFKVGVLPPPQINVEIEELK